MSDEEITERMIDFGNGVLLYWRKGENGQRDEFGIKADRRGFRYLEKMARAKVQTVDEFCGDLFREAFPRINFDAATERYSFNPTAPNTDKEHD